MTVGGPSGDHLRTVLVTIWGPSGDHLGIPWDHLGIIWGRIQSLRVHHGGHLGTIWGPSGDSMGPSGDASTPCQLARDRSRSTPTRRRRPGSSYRSRASRRARCWSTLGATIRRSRPRIRFFDRSDPIIRSLSPRLAPDPYHYFPLSLLGFWELSGERVEGYKIGGPSNFESESLKVSNFESLNNREFESLKL